MYRIIAEAVSLPFMSNGFPFHLPINITFKNNISRHVFGATNEYK